MEHDMVWVERVEGARLLPRTAVQWFEDHQDIWLALREGAKVMVPLAILKGYPEGKIRITEPVVPVPVRLPRRTRGMAEKEE